MAKKIYEFDLEADVEMIEIYDRALQMKIALNEMYKYLREELKYKDPSKERSDILIEIRQKFLDILSDNDISI